MNQTKRKYDSTVARIAGNIVGGLLREQPSQWGHAEWDAASLSSTSVLFARAIVAEVERTEPDGKEDA